MNAPTRPHLGTFRKSGNRAINEAPMGALEVHPTQAQRSLWAQKWGLSRRLARVAAHILNGASDKETSAATGLSISTVRTYVKQVFKAAGVRNRVQLVHCALDATRPRRMTPERVGAANKFERAASSNTHRRRRGR